MTTSKAQEERLVDEETTEEKLLRLRREVVEAEQQHEIRQLQDRLARLRGPYARPY